MRSDPQPLRPAKFSLANQAVRLIEAVRAPFRSKKAWQRRVASFLPPREPKSEPVPSRSWSEAWNSTFGSEASAPVFSPGERLARYMDAANDSLIRLRQRLAR